MPLFQVWIEGYRVTGQSATASFLGTYDVPTFRNACELAALKKKLELDAPREGKPPSIWACDMFDNEADARKAFG